MRCDRCGKEIFSDEPARLISAGGDMEWSICCDCYLMLYDRTDEITALRKKNEGLEATIERVKQATEKLDAACLDCLCYMAIADALEEGNDDD